MANVLFSSLSPELLAVAPNCPVPTMIREIRAATREFCERSFAYRADVSLESVDGGSSEFIFALPADTQLVKPINIKVDSTPLDPVSTKILDARHPNWRTETGVPKMWTRSTLALDGVLIIPPPPATLVGDNGLSAEVSIKPTRTATSVSDILVDRFYDTLITGACHRLLNIPSAAWYNPRAASVHYSQFEHGIVKAMQLANMDDTPKVGLIMYGGI